MNDRLNDDVDAVQGPAQWCKKLRWKSYPVDKDHPFRVLNTFVSGGVTFNCRSTALAVGEDDELAAPETCAPSRSCYEEHPQLTRLKKRGASLPVV